jgi:hypothetical protein
VISHGKLYVIQVYRRALACACGECNVDRLAGVGLHAPLEEPGMKGQLDLEARLCSCIRLVPGSNLCRKSGCSHYGA